MFTGEIIKDHITYLQQIFKLTNERIRKPKRGPP